ncbi:MAG: aminodeoxychorismate synthase component I [Atribacterota bacterium]
MAKLQKKFDTTCFLFETNKIDKENNKSYYFTDPIKILTLDSHKEMNDYFSKIQKLSKRYYIAGFLSYELGYLFEDIFRYKKHSGFPLAVFMVFNQPAVYDHIKKKYISHHFKYPKYSGYSLKDLHINLPKNQYINKVNKIKKHIQKGDIYQANYTLKYKFNFNGEPLDLYRDLKQKQSVGYNSFMRFGDCSIVSISPELFFYKNKKYIKVKPMKGTIKRGKNIQQDRNNMVFLSKDKKNRSENVMIVDLLRNDLSRISEYGSVKVPALFEVEKYETLFQMTSTIESELKRDISIYDIIKNIFPSGSVTGAPKIKSMQILKDIEKEERKAYCGGVGYFTPLGEAKFNVAIRTILIDKNEGEMGIGGGIVYDSDPESEYEECKIKAKFLTMEKPKEFKIIETLLYDKKFMDIDSHLNRMEDSAEYFNFKYNRDKIKTGLNKLRENLNHGKYKIRILLNKNGEIKIERARVKDTSKLMIIISNHKTDPEDVFLFHKTTNRNIYDKELEKARKKGFYDVIFFNKYNQLTEGAVTSIYIEKNGIKYTPKINCGLLNGTIRKKLIKEGKVEEKVLYLRDLKEAENIYISNSIIGFRKAQLK